MICLLLLLVALIPHPNEAFEVRRATLPQRHIVRNLSIPYQAEFSSITQAKPDHRGVFKTYLYEDGKHEWYLLYDGEIPIGFTIKGEYQRRHEFAEFYVVPSYRRQGAGRHLATTLFNQFPGPWQICQLPDATHSTAFWRRVIGDYTEGRYEEGQLDHDDWGSVVFQQFTS